MNSNLSSRRGYLNNKTFSASPETPSPSPIAQNPDALSKPVKSNKKLFTVLGIIAILVIVACFILIQQNQNNPIIPKVTPTPTPFTGSIPLGLNYAIGEEMVYETKTSVDQAYNTSINVETSPITQLYNSTLTMRILAFNDQTYTVTQTMTSSAQDQPLTLPPLNISKTKYYNSFIAPGAPAFFSDITSNPTLSTYLSSSEVNAGDVWQIPISTGNASLGITGNLNLTFSGIEDITVPAGTYKIFKIDIATDTLIMHANLDSDLFDFSVLDGATMRITGQTYLEYGTCRLIKAELQEEVTYPSNGSTFSAAFFSQKILVEHSTP